jgi:hypothetical protein
MNFLKKLFSKRTEEPADVPPEFLQAIPPDWLIDFKGQDLAGGSTISIRVQLFQTARTGAAEIVVLPHEPSVQPKNATTDLTRTEIDRLFVILGFSFPDEIEDVPADVPDGLPVTISIYRQSPLLLRSATCNLAGWLDSRKSAPTAVEIGRILLEARTRALSS